ncbi:hypothetical protein L218DRAFT_1079308 [Marasmius fiardii PR-910]|nr:hypothetical protein L218DRAFT_1079308 [Marasmius fiardii PR-910]
MSTSHSFILFVFLLSCLSSLVAAQGLGTASCKDTGLDWYIRKIGETPCRTYERLRQICNSNFRVGTLNTNTPPDFCDEQVANCCCNNIAFSLSMLCLTCQQGLGTAGNGIDAGQGAYQDYLTATRKSGFCSPQTNKTLPSDVQSAVCNQNISIYDDLYTFSFWSDGSWCSKVTEETINKNQLANPDKVITKCPKTGAVTNSSSSTNSLSSTSSSSISPGHPTAGSGNLNSDEGSSGSSGLSTGATAGIAVAVAIVAIAVIGGLFFWFRRRRRMSGRSGGAILDSPPGRTPPPLAPPHGYSYAPVIAQPNTSQRDDTRFVSSGAHGGTDYHHHHPNSSSQQYTVSSHSLGPYSPTTSNGIPANETGPGYPLDYPAQQQQHTNSGGSQPVSVGYASHNALDSHSRSVSSATSGRERQRESQIRGFIVANAGDALSNTGSSINSRSEGRLTSPYSPTSGSLSGTETTTASRSSRSFPHPSGLPGKAGTPHLDLGNNNARYVPSMVEVEGRHLDAGPVPGSEGLRRNVSGRLPPAYGDLVRVS